MFRATTKTSKVHAVAKSNSARRYPDRVEADLWSRCAECATVKSIRLSFQTKAASLESMSDFTTVRASARNGASRGEEQKLALKHEAVKLLRLAWVTLPLHRDLA
eukprot:1089128-Pleurochrysis_carterae.AAC.1